MLLRHNPNSEVLLTKLPKKGSEKMQKLHEYYLMYWERIGKDAKVTRVLPYVLGK